MTELYQDATGEVKARSLVDASMIAGEEIVHDAAAVDLEHAENRFQSGQYIVLDMAAQARRDQRVRVRLVEAGEALLTALNAVATLGQQRPCNGSCSSRGAVIRTRNATPRDPRA